MADKKTQRMAQFYEQCQAKGYTNMRDEKQSLKAKVIASDLNLNYGDIVVFYEKAKEANALANRERAEEAERRRIQKKKEADEAARRAVKGELLVTISDRVHESSDAKVIRVYIRPDNSIYSTLNNGGKIEGPPTVGAKKGGAMLLTYHPSKAVYTGATVGGVTTGGVHYTDAYYSPSTTNSGKGDVAVSLNGTEFTADLITMSDYTGKLFKRDGAYKNLVYKGQIQCFRESSKADFYMNGIATGRLDYQTTMNALSMAVDERRLYYSTCANIANLLGRIVHGQFPPSDEQIYASAAALAKASDSATLKRAYETFDSISDYKDAAKQAKIVRSKYDEVLQEEKERAILEKEARMKKAKKAAIVTGIIIAIAVAVAVLLTAVIIPGIKYNNAKALMESGQYEEAIAAFEALDGYKDSDAQIEACNTAILDGKYADAAELMANGQYEESIVAFKAMNGYKDSDAQIEACNTAILDGKYADAAALMANGQYEEAIAAFEAMNGYKDSSGKISECHVAILEAKHNEAVALMEAGKYEKAYEIFDFLDSYSDSAEQAKKCALSLAKNFETTGDGDRAIKWYELCGDKENADRIRYEYVSANLSNTDKKTYEYLMVLKKRDYKDTSEIYDKLYKITVKLFFNLEKDDTTTSKTMFYNFDGKRWRSGFCHYQVSGGTPSDAVNLRFVYETRWGDDNELEDYEVRSDSVVSVMPTGEDNIYYLDGASNFYYHRITVYDTETGEQLAQAVLYRPYSYY